MVELNGLVPILGNRQSLELDIGSEEEVQYRHIKCEFVLLKPGVGRNKLCTVVTLYGI